MPCPTRSRRTGTIRSGSRWPQPCCRPAAMAKPSSNSSLRCAGRPPTAGLTTDWRNCIWHAATPPRRARPKLTSPKPGSATASFCRFRICEARPPAGDAGAQAGASFASSNSERLARPRALRSRVHGVERLACGHEQAVAFGAAEADVAADFRQTDAADQLAVRRPDRDTAVADGATGVAGCPEVAVDVAAQAVGAALHAVDHAIAEPLEVRELVVGADIRHEDFALAAGAGIARALASAGDVELLVVSREAEAIGIGHLLLGHDKVDAPGRIEAIAVGRQFAFARHEAGGLADPWIELAAGVAGATRDIRLTL